MHELVKACVSNPVETSQRINDDPQVETDIILEITNRARIQGESRCWLTLDHDAASAVGQEGSSNPILQKYFYGSKSEQKIIFFVYNQFKKENLCYLSP